MCSLQFHSTAFIFVLLVMYAVLKALKLHKIKNVKCVLHLFCCFFYTKWNLLKCLNTALYPFKNKFRNKCFKRYIFNLLKIIIFKSINSSWMEHIRRNSWRHSIISYVIILNLSVDLQTLHVIDNFSLHHCLLFREEICPSFVLTFTFKQLLSLFLNTWIRSNFFLWADILF